MPAIMLKNIPAGTANALDGLKFQEIPQGGAFVTIYASSAAAGGRLSYSVENEDHLVNAEPNVETSADVVDTDRDLILDREPVGSGKQFLSTSAQITNVLLVIE